MSGQKMGRLFDSLMAEIRSLENCHERPELADGDKRLMMASYHLSMCRNILADISRQQRRGRKRGQQPQRSEPRRSLSRE